MLNTISTIASSSGDSPFAVVAFAIACAWFYLHLSKKDNEHEIKMKQLENEKQEK